MSTIGILLSSTRPRRIGHHVADWVIDNAPDGVQTTLFDLREIDLPLLDEPDQPSNGNYAHQHTRDWSASVLGVDAMIIVTAEYNSGYPAPLKNAIDFLWAEWKDLPVGCVGYGWGGAGKAIDALDRTLRRLQMKVHDPVGLSFTDTITEAGEVGVPNPAPVAELSRLYRELAAADSPRVGGAAGK